MTEFDNKMKFCNRTLAVSAIRSRKLRPAIKSLTIGILECNYNVESYFSKKVLHYCQQCRLILNDFKPVFVFRSFILNLVLIGQNLENMRYGLHNMELTARETQPVRHRPWVTACESQAFWIRSSDCTLELAIFGIYSAKLNQHWTSGKIVLSRWHSPLIEQLQSILSRLKAFNCRFKGLKIWSQIPAQPHTFRLPLRTRWITLELQAIQPDWSNCFRYRNGRLIRSGRRFHRAGFDLCTSCASFLAKN